MQAKDKLSWHCITATLHQHKHIRDTYPTFLPFDKFIPISIQTDFTLIDTDYSYTSQRDDESQRKEC